MSNAKLFISVIIIAINLLVVIPVTIIAADHKDPLPNLNVYLNCNYCYQDFIRTEITFVNFVQDQFVSDVNLMITTLSTGSSGQQFNLIFTGARSMSGINDTLIYTANGINTDAEKRDELAHLIKLGLVRYLLKSGNHSMLDLASTNPADSNKIGVGANPGEDPWNAWVFNVSSNVDADGQKVSKSFSIYNSVSANRTTEKSKFNLNANSNYSINKFTFDGETYKFEQRSQYVGLLHVHSLNEHWSAGFFGSATRSIFGNYDLNTDAQLAVEYNIYPYKEAQTKSITFSYFLGGSFFDFTDSTIYNKTKAVYSTHYLSLNGYFNKAWGSLSGAIYANQFINDMKKFRYGAYVNFDIRIFKGFSVNGYLSYSTIADQINIRKAGATDDEILLQQRELATNFSFYSYVGVNYRFGSIYNNVVNPRFSNR